MEKPLVTDAAKGWDLKLPARCSGLRIAIRSTSIVVALMNGAVRTALANEGWSWGPLLPERRTAFGCTANEHGIVTVGGSYWKSNAAGVSQKQWLTAVDHLQSDVAKWEALPSFPTPVDYSLVVSLHDRIYAIGGQNDSGKVRQTYWLCLTDQPPRWLPGPTLPRPLSRLRGGTWGNKIVAVTDEHTSASSEASQSGPKVIVWDSDDATGNWIDLTDVPEPSIGFRAAAVVGDRVFVFGGASQLENEQLRLTNQVWQCNLHDGEWKSCSKLPVPIRDATAVPINERYVALTGGVEEAIDARNTPDREARILLSARCIIYDTVSDEFLAASPLRLATADHGAAVLRNRLFVVGGEDSPYRTRTDLVQHIDVKLLLGELGDTQ